MFSQHLGSLSLCFFLCFFSGFDLRFPSLSASETDLTVPVSRFIRPLFPWETETDPLKIPFYWALFCYNRFISPADGASCSFSPTCSVYARQAISRHGPLIGFSMSAERVIRYHADFDYNFPIYYPSGEVRLFDSIDYSDFWFGQNKTEKYLSYRKHFEFGKNLQGRQKYELALYKSPQESEEFEHHAGDLSVSTTSSIPLSLQQILHFADTLYAAEDYERAITEYLRALDLFPQNSLEDKILYRIGQSYQALQKYPKARRYFELVMRNFPHSLCASAALFQTAQGYFAQKQYTKAFIYYQDFITTYPEHPDAPRAFFMSGWCMLEYQNYQQALEIYQSPPVEGLDFPKRSEFLVSLAQYPAIPHRSPELSALLSAFIPGSGQFYCGRYQNAFAALLVNSLFFVGTYEAFSHHLYTAGSFLALFSLGWYSGNIFSAVNSAHQFNAWAEAQFIESLKTGYPPPAGPPE